MSDHSFKGILLAFVAFGIFSISDASAKMLAGTMPPVETAFFGAFFSLFALPFIKKKEDRWSDTVRSTRPSLWLIRFIFAGLGAISSVTAFSILSMAEAFALIFLLPCFVTIMSVAILREKVGPIRWAAVLIGFIGVMIVLRPGFRELSFGHLCAIFAGFASAISIIIYRAMGPKEKNISLFSSGTFGIFVICGLAMIPVFQVPELWQLGLLASYGILAGTGNLLLIIATRLTSGTIVGPIQYSQMLWAIGLGYLLFGDIVDSWMLIGIVFIIGSGMLTLIREKVKNVPAPSGIAGIDQSPSAVMPDQ